MSETDIVTSISRAVDELPAVIPLPKIERPHANAICPLSKVKSPADLPGRLFLGCLDTQSFHMTAEGWKATYLDHGGETRVELSFKKGTNRLWLEQTWRGIWGCGGTSSSDEFGHLARSVGGFPSVWDDPAKEDLEARYNVQYLPTQDGAYVITGFPDGAFKSLACPVPVSKLRDLIACHRKMDGDPAIKTNISGHLHLQSGAVNYLVGRNGLFASDPDILYTHTFGQTGLPPLALPVWETGGDGTRALTVHRLIYIYNVMFSFRELERVVKHLCDHGIVGSADALDRSDTAPSAPEFAAVILQAGLEVQPIEFNYFDSSQRRRTFYERFTDMDAFLSLADDRNPEETATSIELAETVSRRLADQFQNALERAPLELVH